MDLTTPVGDVEFVAFDFETTGLNPAVDRIVEFGAVRFRGESILGEFGQLVNPGMSINPDAERVSGISDEMVRDCPPIAEVLPGFVDFLGSAVLVAHNANFDLGFLRAATQTGGYGAVENLVADTLILAMKAFPRRKSYALQNLAEELQLPKGSAHRARDDAELCMRLFLACVDAMSFMGDLELKEILAGPASG